MYDDRLVADLLKLVGKMNEKVLVYAETNKFERGAQLNEDITAILNIVEKYVEEATKVVDKS